jgi:hypothetical protein
MICWLVALTVVFAFGWYKSAENTRDQAAMNHWSRRQAELLRSESAAVAQVRNLLRTYHGRPNSQRAMERELNRGEPFRTQRIGARDVVRWTDAVHNFGYRLSFDNGVLSGWNMDRGNVRQPLPSRTAWDGPAETWRRRIVRLGVNLWFVGLLGWFIATRRRQYVARSIAAQVMLGAALASGMAWLVNPVYTISWAGVFSNDGLAFAAIMVASALYLLAVSLADEPANRLAGVSFGMRHLLIATTLVAAVLATGPIGYVTLLTLVAGLSMFAVFYYFHRTSASSGAPSP